MRLIGAAVFAIVTTGIRQDPDTMTNSVFDESRPWNDGHRLNNVLISGIPQLANVMKFMSTLIDGPNLGVKTALQGPLQTLLKSLQALNITVDNPSNPESGMRARVAEMANMAVDLGELLKTSGKDTKKGLTALVGSNMKAVEGAQKILDSTLSSLTQAARARLEQIGNTQVASARSFDDKTEADSLRYEGVAGRMTKSRLTRLDNVNGTLSNAGEKFGDKLSNMKSGAAVMTANFSTGLRDIETYAKERELSAQEQAQTGVMDKFIGAYNKQGSRVYNVVAKNYSRSLGAVNALLASMKGSRQKIQAGADEQLRVNLSDVSSGLRDLANRPASLVNSVGVAYRAAESAMNAAEQDFRRSLSTAFADSNAAMNQTTIQSKKDQEIYEGRWTNTELLLSGKTDGLSADFINGLASMEAGAGGELAAMQQEAAETALAAGSSSEQSIDSLISSSSEVSKHVTNTQASMRSQQDKLQKLMSLDSTQLNATMNLLLGFLKQRQAAMNATMTGAVGGITSVQDELALENERRLKSISGSVGNLTAADRVALEAQLRTVAEAGNAGSESAAMMLQALSEGNLNQFALLQMQLGAVGDGVSFTVDNFFKIRGIMDLNAQGAIVSKKDAVVNTTRFLDQQALRLGTVRQNLLSKLALAQTDSVDWNLEAEKTVRELIDLNVTQLPTDISFIASMLENRSVEVEEFLKQYIVSAASGVSENEADANQHIFDFNVDLINQLAAFELQASEVTSNTSWISNVSDAAVASAVYGFMAEVEKRKLDFDNNLVQPTNQKLFASMNSTNDILVEAESQAQLLETQIAQGADFSSLKFRINELVEGIRQFEDAFSISKSRVGAGVQEAMQIYTGKVKKLVSHLAGAQSELGSNANASTVEGVNHIENATATLRQELTDSRQKSLRLSNQVAETVQGYLDAEYSVVAAKNSSITDGDTLVHTRLAELDDVFDKAVSVLFNSILMLDQAFVEAGGASTMQASDVKRMTSELASAVGSTTDSSGDAVIASIATIQSLNEAMQTQSARDMANGVGGLGYGAEAVSNATRDVGQAVVAQTTSLVNALGETDEQVSNLSASADGVVEISSDQITRILQILMQKHASVRTLLSAEHQKALEMVSSVAQVIKLAEGLAQASQEHVAAGFENLRAYGGTVQEGVLNRTSVMTRNVTDQISIHTGRIQAAIQAATRSAKDQLPLVEVQMTRINEALRTQANIAADAKKFESETVDKLKQLNETALHAEDSIPEWLSNMQNLVNAKIAAIQDQVSRPSTAEINSPNHIASKTSL